MLETKGVVEVRGACMGMAPRPPTITLVGVETKGVVEVRAACVAGTAAGSTSGIGAAIASADARTMMALNCYFCPGVCGHAWKAVVWEVLYKLGIPEPSEGSVLSPYE